jgi:hypothetical protein
MRAPTPQELSRFLNQTADRLADEGERAVRRAPVLAARGYPPSTNGSEGGRSSNPTSSTERAALNPDPKFDDIDGRLREHMRLCWYMAVKIHANLDVIMAHASDDDPVPVGTGRCVRCDKFCRPDDKHPHNRIRAGFCPACDTGWRRAGKPDRGTYIRSYIAEAAG